MSRIAHIWENLGIRERLLITYILLVTIPMAIIGLQYFDTTKGLVSNIVRNNLHETVVKNNQIVDSKLEQIKEYSLGFVIDSDLANLFARTHTVDNKYDMYLLDQQITHILNKYFLHSPDIFSVYLLTNHYVFGNNPNRGYIPANIFHQTELFEQAAENEGKLAWAPTYSFVDMYRQPQMSDINFDYKYMFSALKLMNSTDFTFRRQAGTDVQTENPVLLVNFTDEFFRKIFDNNIPINNMYYFIISRDGRFVTHQDKSKLGEKVEFDWLNGAYQKGSGTDIVTIDGKRMIITYDMSTTTDWMSVFAVQEDFIISDVMPVIRSNVFSAVLVVTLVLLLISYLLSVMISRPIRSLNRAIGSMGRGNFEANIPEEGSYEFKKLINTFNSMNVEIQTLIQENYETTIMKKEAEIKALNLQLNPHFMYNTLNIINLKLIKNGQDETSEIIMSLSTMLKYSLETDDDVILLHKDMNYTKSYVHIMGKRFEGMFQVEYHIDPRLYEYYVPKFFLQPLVENALLHGFKDMAKPGLLSISGWLSGDKRYFCVEDNGVGMDENKLRELSSQPPASVGISNVRSRIKMIYGEEYDIVIESAPQNGTKITICLPC